MLNSLVGPQGLQGEPGADGTSVTVTSVSESTADGGSNVVTFSDGKKLTVKNGSKGSQGEKGETGATGANATINGVNALTLATGSGLSGSQSGNTYTLSLASHNQAASTITAGAFAGQVAANSSAQTPGTSLLRNSKLVSAETNPTVNGEICWTYE